MTFDAETYVLGTWYVGGYVHVDRGRDRGGCCLCVRASIGRPNTKVGHPTPFPLSTNSSSTTIITTTPIADPTPLPPPVWSTSYMPTHSRSHQPINPPHTTDPTRPRLVDLLTEEEFKKFQRMRVNARPVYVMSEMNLLAYRIISLSRDSMVRVFWGESFFWRVCVCVCVNDICNMESSNNIYLTSRPCYSPFLPF